MGEIVKNILLVCGAISVIIAALYAIRKLGRSIKPIQISTSIKMVFDETEADSIGAVITNRSEETIYIVNCYVHESKSLKYSLLTHLKHPFIKPSLYPCVWWGSTTYKLLRDNQHKLESGESIDLRHYLNLKSQSFGFSESEFKVRVKLSTGRSLSGKRTKIPPSWHFSSLRKNA